MFDSRPNKMFPSLEQMRDGWGWSKASALQCRGQWSFLLRLSLSNFLAGIFFLQYFQDILLFDILFFVFCGRRDNRETTPLRGISRPQNKHIHNIYILTFGANMYLAKQKQICGCAGHHTNCHPSHTGPWAGCVPRRPPRCGGGGGDPGTSGSGARPQPRGPPPRGPPVGNGRALAGGGGTHRP